MSLINDVLKDLDDRRAGGEAVRHSHAGATIAPLREKSTQLNWYRLLLVLMVLAGVLALTLFLYQLYGNYQQRLVSDEAQNEEARALLHPDAAAAVSRPKVAAQPARAQISAVFVTPLEQGARIEVQLTQKIEHQVNAPNRQQLLIRLPHTELTALLPSVAGHPLVAALDVASEQDGLALRVTLARPANFQTYLLARGQYHALILDIFAIPEATNLTNAAISAASPSKPTEKAKAALETAGEQLVDTMPVETNPTENKSTENNVFENKAIQNSGRVNLFSKTASNPSLAERDRRQSKDALNRMRSGQSESAVAALQQFLAENPEARQARETLAVWALSQNQLELAETTLSEGLRISPQNPALIKLQARLLSAREQQPQALALLNTHLAQNNRDQEYLALLASLFQQQGQHARAIELYRVLLKRDAGQAQWWVASAISLEALALKQDALRAYVQARRIPTIDARLKQYADSRIQALN